MSAPKATSHYYARFDLRRSTGRLAVGAIAGLTVSLLPFLGGSSTFRAVAGWDAGALVLLAFVWWLILEADPKETRRRAAAEDPGRTAVWLLVLLGSSFSVFAGTVVMRHADRIAPERSSVLVVLCLAAVVLAWALTHTSFTLRYAHLYYRTKAQGGLTFPGDRDPDDFDFAYFSFTIGMCYQVSDITVVAPAFRRTVLGHSLLSFAYNTAIVALVLNLLVGVLK